MNPRRCPADLDKFHKETFAYRRKTASDPLDAFQNRLRAIFDARAEFTDLNGLVAYVAVKQDLERSIDLRRRQMQRAASASKNKNCTTGAGRSPAIKAHGCAVLASLAGSFSDALNRSGNARKVTG